MAMFKNKSNEITWIQCLVYIIIAAVAIAAINYSFSKSKPNTNNNYYVVLEDTSAIIYDPYDNSEVIRLDSSSKVFKVLLKDNE